LAGQVLFPLFLYLLGAALLLPVAAVPLRFVAWTAFAWGALAWIVSALLALILPLPVTPFTVLCFLATISLFEFILLRRRLRPLGPGLLKRQLLPFGLFGLVVSLPALLQIAHVLPDSFDMLLIARDMADGEVAVATLANFGVYGPAWPLLQISASWMDAGFNYSLPAAITFTLVAALRYFCQEGLLRQGWAAGAATRLANLVTLLFVSTLWVFFQFTYFHNGSLASLYLLLGVGGLWISSIRREKSWLSLGILALLGFALTRIETVLLAVVILAIAISGQRFSAKEWMRPLLLFSAVAVAWYGWLGMVARPETAMLNSQRIPVFAGMVVLPPVSAISMRWAVVRRLVLPHLYIGLMVGIGAIVAVLAALFPAHFLATLGSTVGNFYSLGTLWWGITWWLVLGFYLILIQAPPVSSQRLFVGAILGFWTLYLMLGIVAGGYSVRADSTASRMGLHILPVILLYLTLRAAPYLNGISRQPGRRP
jgi:hypothetical protein